MNTTTPRPPLPRWIWVVGGAILAAVIVVGVVLWAQRPTDPEASPSPTATADPSTTPGADNETVTGCLAEGQSVDMLLATQESAPQSGSAVASRGSVLVIGCLPVVDPRCCVSSSSASMGISAPASGSACGRSP